MDNFDKNLLDRYVSLTSISVEKHYSEDLYIYGYHTGLDLPNIIWDKNNIHCRGLIIDSKGKVKARPFPKFFTYRSYLNETTLMLSENRTLKIPNENFEIFEKVDGTMTTLYWVEDIPYLATQRSFSNPNAVEATKILHEKYSHTFSKLNKNRTYIFEAIFPKTNVLIDYGNDKELYLIGVINTETSENLPLEEIGFPCAKNFTNEFSHIKNFEGLRNLNLPNKEGFVIVFENGERIKLKFPWYKEAHNIMAQIVRTEKKIFMLNRMLSNKMGFNNKSLTELQIWDILKNGGDFDKIFNIVPDIYFSIGLQFWVDNIVNNLNKQFNNLQLQNKTLSDEQIWQEIRPLKFETFKYEIKVADTKYSTPMWERMERLRRLFI